MSWNLLNFAFPAVSLSRLFKLLNPDTYKKFDGMPQSEHAAAVNKIAAKVLGDQNVKGAEYFERVNDMLTELPDSIVPKTIDSLLRHRLKVVEVKADDLPVFATGTDVKEGKYYIGIAPEDAIAEALPWLITHELSHILNDDPLTSQIVKTVVSLGVTALATFVFGWSLLPSLGATILTNSTTHIICCQRQERAADDFAIKHSSREDLKKGINFLTLLKTRRMQGIYKDNLITRALHPSEDARIAKIQAALELRRPSVIT